MFRFPNPVNEYAARTVALGVVTLSVAILATGQHWLLLPLAYGFLARVLTGPRLSPLGLLATRVVAPRLPLAPRLVPGPPKRFAQGMGLAFSATAAVLALGLHLDLASNIVLLGLVTAASLEAFAGICLGCRIFAVGMRLGVIPSAVCEACNDLSARRLPHPAS
jgi:hypothetical protein